MKTFKAFINEKNNPNWVRVSIGTMALKVRKLTSQIENETDPTKQNTLIAQQNNEDARWETQCRNQNSAMTALTSYQL